MVVESGGYHGPSFKGYCGETQGDPMPPTILNVVLDTVIIHWDTVVTTTEVGKEGIGKTVKDLEAYFYANNSIIVFPWPERLQRSFDFLTELFNRFGLLKNMRNMVRMECRPCHIPGVLLEAAY